MSAMSGCYTTWNSTTSSLFLSYVLGAIKIVSDNLDVDEYAESIHTSTDEIWAQVRSLVDGIMQRPKGLPRQYPR